MEIDIKLLEETEKQRISLCEILRKAKCSKEYTIKEIKGLTTSLGKLNELPEEFRRNYRKQLEEQAKKRNENKPFKDLLSDMKLISGNWDLQTNEGIKNFGKQVTNFSQKYIDDNSIDKIMERNFHFDMAPLHELLVNDLVITFARQRKFIFFLTDYIFKFRYLIANLILAIISFTLGYIVEVILRFISPETAEFHIGLLVAIIFFFTVDKAISAKEDRIFWSIARNQISVINTQFAIYLDQIIAIQRFQAQKS